MMKQMFSTVPPECWSSIISQKSLYKNRTLKSVGFNVLMFKICYELSGVMMRMKINSLFTQDHFYYNVHFTIYGTFNLTKL